MENAGRIIGNTVAWILAILLAVSFLMFGGIKLINAPGMVQEFAQIGFGQWLRYITGILEVSGAIGVLIPKFRFWAALQIATVMAGATLTNLAILHLPGTARFTAVLLALALTLAWLRRPQSVQKAKVAHA
jgi:putative oxidoreductase